MSVENPRRTRSRDGAPDERDSTRTQATSRHVNERRTGGDHLPESTGSHVIACECADPTCLQALAISADEWQELCREPRRFAVLRGHVYPDVECVVAEFRTHVVVERLGRRATG